MKFNLIRVLRLWLRFCWQCVWSGIVTAKIILRAESPPAGFLRLKILPMSPRGAALLGAMITLTPGSTLIDIDMEKREMLLHILDISKVETSSEGIRRDFEEDIAALFPEESLK